jgi:membrane protease YdiL (CAAX protease family)
VPDVRKHPVLAYFILTFAGTWVLQLPMLLGQDGLAWFGWHVPLPAYVILFIASGFAPCVAALWLTRQIEGRDGLKRFLRRFIQWRVGPVPYLVGFLAYPLVYLLATFIATGGIPIAGIRREWAAVITAYLPAILVFPALITWGEEPGWRGFALTRLQERHHPLVATLIVGSCHALWHLPIFFLVSGPPAAGPFELSQFLGNSGTILLISITWTWVFNRARQSILIAVLLHASGNAVGPLMARWIGPFSPAMGHALLGIYTGAAALVILATRGRLGREP